jgi:hypothetical protein
MVRRGKPTGARSAARGKTDGRGSPRPQELPECPRHPGLPCPGECQYLLAAGECLNDRGLLAPMPAPTLDWDEDEIDGIRARNPSAQRGAYP